MDAPFSYYDYDAWYNFISNSDADPEIINDGIDYLNTCRDNNIPFILSFNQFSYIWSLDIHVIGHIITFPEAYYRNFTIPKRNGDNRFLSSPYPSLFLIQRWILEQILNKASISKNATGFCRGRSIVDHASLHVKNDGLLKLDLQDFFPSIPLKRVISAFKYIGYPSKIATSLARFCCVDKCLPQGAPTSPALSNIITRKMDYRLEMLCKKYDFIYSRYADDLAFSGKYIPKSFIPVVENIVNNEGFVINNAKTVLVNGQGKKILTGISISDNKIKLPRENRRLLRVEANNALNNDFNKVVIDIGDPIYYERLIGKFMFWLQLEPNNQYVISTLSKLKIKAS